MKYGKCACRAEAKDRAARGQRDADEAIIGLEERSVELLVYRREQRRDAGQGQAENAARFSGPAGCVQIAVTSGREVQDHRLCIGKFMYRGKDPCGRQPEYARRGDAARLGGAVQRAVRAFHEPASNNALSELQVVENLYGPALRKAEQHVTIDPVEVSI